MIDLPDFKLKPVMRLERYADSKGILIVSIETFHDERGSLCRTADVKIHTKRGTWRIGISSFPKESKKSFIKRAVLAAVLHKIKRTR